MAQINASNAARFYQTHHLHWMYITIHTALSADLHSAVLFSVFHYVCVFVCVSACVSTKAEINASFSLRTLMGLVDFSHDDKSLRCLSNAGLQFLI